MSSEKKPKWEIGMVIQKGKQSVELTKQYGTDLQPRLQVDELSQHEANVEELEKRRSGQTEQVVTLKSKTLGQDQAIDQLHQTVISIRNIVKAASPDPEMEQAYGVGEKIYRSVSSVMAASNITLAAYQANTAWSNSVGIVEADMEEIATLQAALSSADQVQEASKFTRKSATMDKNSLQRTVEDEITKLSALGQRVFQNSDPSVVQLFADLIPA
jgi:hypothetical protein